MRTLRVRPRASTASSVEVSLASVAAKAAAKRSKAADSVQAAATKWAGAADLKGEKPATLTAPDGSELGDLTTDRSAYLIAQDVLRKNVDVGLFKVCKFMKANMERVDVQLKGVKAIGDIAQYGNRQTRQRNKGQAHVEQYDLSILSTLQAAILNSNAGPTILAAMIHHHKDRAVVLRGCWSLEHILGTSANFDAFKLDGGKHVVKMIKTLYKGDKEIMTSVKALQRKPQTGIIKPCFSRCTIC